MVLGRWSEDAGRVTREEELTLGLCGDRSREQQDLRAGALPLPRPQAALQGSFRVGPGKCPQHRRHLQAKSVWGWTQIWAERWRGSSPRQASLQMRTSMTCPTVVSHKCHPGPSLPTPHHPAGLSLGGFLCEAFPAPDTLQHSSRSQTSVCSQTASLR